MAYDQNKAAAYNKLIQGGASEEEAAKQAGIGPEDDFNYSIGDNGLIGPLVVGSGTRNNEVIVKDQPPQSTYPQTAAKMVTSVTNTSYTSTSTETVSGGGSTTRVSNQPIVTASSQAYAEQGAAKQAEIDQFIKENPSNFARSRQGLPPLSAEEAAARAEKLRTLEDQRSSLYNSEQDAKGYVPPTDYTVPNTTTTTTTTTTYKSNTQANLVFTNQDETLSQQNEEYLATTPRVANSTSATDTPLNPASDPSQFPAYDDEGNLQPGFAINQETGDTYYRGFPSQDTRNQPVGEAGWYDYGTEYSDPATAPSYADADIPLPIDSPYYGLTPEQIQKLGGADPTDPYIRARLGIPQLSNSPIKATGGLGTTNVNVAAIGAALGIPKAVTSLFDGIGSIASSIGGLFGSKPTATATAATTGSGVAGLTQTVTGPGTKDTPVNPASDPSQFPAYDDEGNLQPGFKINEETGQPYYAGVGPGTGTNATTLSADQADAFYNGTGTPTAAQQAATDAQTAADAAALYPGTNNTNLKEINAAQAAIDQNTAGIARAEEIIAQNDAELADPNISDARRAELEANNKAQFEYIDNANQNTTINQSVIEANANAFAAGGGDPTSGQGPMEVAALEDPGLEPPAAQDVGPLTEADVPVDPLTDEELAVQEAFQQDNREILAAQATDVEPGDDPFEQARLEAAAATAAEGPTEANLDVDPLTDEELAVQEAYQQDQRDQLAETDSPTEVSPEQDPFEQARLEAEAAANAEGPTEANLDVDPLTDEELAVQEAYQQDQRDQLASENFVEQPADVDPNTDLELPPGAEPDEVESAEPFALNPDEDPGIGGATGADFDVAFNQGPSEESFQGSQAAAVREKAKAQATFQARYKQPGNSDWRVRLSLSPNAQYLYNAGTPRGSAAGILAPLAATDGVIFPYTPSITTTYSANYEQYDLVHSNYRGIFYKNSRVGDIQLRGTFTAQDSVEANYLLAVIHFFRSATKMFYGQDAERGTPPPVCLLNGLGTYQFSDHPVVISSFNYTTPNDVDYIRATNPNNYGSNLLNRRTAVASNPGGSSLAGLNRLLNALPTGLSKGAIPNVPAPGSVQQSVNNTAGATYVPTKIEIDITLIPVQTRAQVSKQFSLKGFANGDLLKGGFW